jgi:Tripartite tricarboxylate transporter TctB family
MGDSVKNVHVLRSVALLAFAALFGWQASKLNLGTFSRAGPGLFPLMVCGLLALIAILMLIESRFEPYEAVSGSAKSIFFVIAGIIGFAFLAHWSVIPAVLFLVFVSSFAGSDYSVVRCLQISAALIAIAAGFRYGLGVNLRLF